MKSLIIGLGNPIVGDDGIGIKVMEHIKDKKNLPMNTDVLADVSMAGLSLVERFRGYDKVILIDSIQTGHNPIGNVVQLRPEEFSLTLHTSDYHNMDLITALEFSKKMYDDVPKDIKIIGIEIIKPNEFSDKLSSHLRSRFENITNQVHNLILENLKDELKQNSKFITEKGDK
ncbi:MAG: hydrogenase maturation protease [Candidatus Heimdallarchaeaceae archaeon]